MKSPIVGVLFFVSLFLSTAHASSFDPNESMIGIDVKAIDTSVKPCDDFYQYACGTWIKNLELPADKSRVVRSFTEIYDRNIDILHKILENGAKGKGRIEAEAQKLNDFYASCVNEKEIEKVSPSALKAQFATLDQLKTKDDLSAYLAQIQLRGVSAFFSFGSETDLVDPDHKIASIAQGGMGLPDSTYYTSSDPSKADIRKAYVAYIEKMLVLTHIKPAVAKTEAQQIYAVEETLAKSALTPEQYQDPTVNYHPVVEQDLKTAASVLNWDTYFKSLGINAPKKIDLNEPKFLAAVQTLVSTTDLATIRTYLRYRMLEEYAPDLGKKIYNTWFAFYGTKLSGQKIPEPRWKRCVQKLGQREAMGEVLGKEFVKTTFSAKAKVEALQMIANIRIALKADLNGLDWLDRATREKALEKLEKISLKIGYPDKWKDYSALQISKHAFLENIIHSMTFAEREDLDKIGGPVDPTLWDMEPQVVNAYYAPDLNQINFPAGILQAPFFAETFSTAQNYGAIGMVIGHEITHGFDTVGSKFDGRGMMSDWWTSKVKKQFEEKTSCMKKQYSAYEPLPGLHENGDLTITENIADNGGLKIAHAAYLLTKDAKDGDAKTNGAINSDMKKQNTNVSQFTDEQQFFLSAAQAWCAKATDAAVRRQVSTDPHSPPKFRIIGSFSNNIDFAKAFSCGEGTPMAPKNRCLIW
jgi:putative endopeptidase